MTPRHPSQTGISLVEVAIVVSVMAMLTGILAPAGFQLVGQARDVRVLHDCQGIRDALVKMLTDLGKTSLRLAGDTSPRVELLVSDGPVPSAASATETAWTRDVEATAPSTCSTGTSSPTTPLATPPAAGCRRSPPARSAGAARTSGPKPTPIPGAIATPSTCATSVSARTCWCSPPVPTASLRRPSKAITSPTAATTSRSW